MEDLIPSNVTLANDDGAHKAVMVCSELLFQVHIFHRKTDDVKTANIGMRNTKTIGIFSKF